MKPDFAEASSNLGVVQLALGKHAEAAETFRRLLEQDANNPTFHFNLGLALKGLGRLGEARASLEECVRQSEPESERARRALAVIESMAEVES